VKIFTEMISTDSYYQDDLIPVGDSLGDERLESSESDDSSERARYKFFYLWHSYLTTVMVSNGEEIIISVLRGY
jgi:hypothetical protein